MAGTSASASEPALTSLEAGLAAGSPAPAAPTSMLLVALAVLQATVLFCGFIMVMVVLMLD